MDDVLLGGKGTGEVRQLCCDSNQYTELNKIQLGTTKTPQESSSSRHLVPTDLKEAPHNPIQNIPLGLPTDSNAAYEEGARPGILKAQE